MKVQKKIDIFISKSRTVRPIDVVQYDTNKVIEKLVNAVIALGGNVTI